MRKTTSVARVAAGIFASLSDRDGPSGLGAIVRAQTARLEELPVREDAPLVALHRIGNPGNLGTIIRTADATGAGGVILLGETTDPFAPAAVKASMGALFALPVAHVADPARFGAADARLIAEWPQDALPKLGLDPYTAVLTLAHVAHIDDEALKLAIRANCLYVAALGSSRNHAKRRERLLAAGITEEELSRIKAPIGLDIGAQTPAEIAVSIMAEVILAVRGTRKPKS